MFEELFLHQSELFKALAHPRRLEIIHLLREQILCVTDIHQMLNLPQANISQHLMILRDAGLVKVEREGKQIFYRLSHPDVIEVADMMRSMVLRDHPELSAHDYKLMDLVPLVEDPVCKMRLSPKTASYACTHDRHKYYFCASGCLKVFEKNPEKFVTNS